MPISQIIFTRLDMNYDHYILSISYIIFNYSFKNNTCIEERHSKESSLVY